jgi:hypothetical protein
LWYYKILKSLLLLLSIKAFLMKSRFGLIWRLVCLMKTIRDNSEGYIKCVNMIIKDCVLSGVVKCERFRSLMEILALTNNVSCIKTVRSRISSKSPEKKQSAKISRVWSLNRSTLISFNKNRAHIQKYLIKI